MSLSQNLQNILDDTFDSLLFMDTSFNLSTFPNMLSSVNTSISQSIDRFSSDLRRNRSSVGEEEKEENEENEENEEQEEPEEQDTTSLPDLIPIDNHDRIVEDDNIRRLRLWSNLLDDYNTQMTLYQKNIRTILNITENILPVQRPISSSRRAPATTPPRVNTTSVAPRNIRNTTNNTLDSATTNRLLQWLMRNPSSYVLEFDTILPTTTTTTRNTTVPTSLQIQTATTLFTYEPQENPLTVNTCPITLEDFREGERLMRINGCGHIFKANALHHWFERNHRCPSCRYDICLSTERTESAGSTEGTGRTERTERVRMPEVLEGMNV